MKLFYLISIIIAFSCQRKFLHSKDVGLSNSNSSKDSVLIWNSNNRLLLSDFKGIPKLDNGIVSAESSISIPYKFHIEDSFLVVDVYALFNRFNSWSFDDDTVSMLNHEQRHFDIAELTCRMIRKDLIDNNYVNGTLHQQWTLVRTTVGFYIGNFMLDEQSSYDQQTGHGTNPEKQIEWNNRIDSLLHEYVDYANPSFKLPISDTL